MNCSRCGAQVMPGARFCDVCGTGIAYRPAPAPAAAPSYRPPAGRPTTYGSSANSNLAVAGMILGIVAVVFDFIPFGIFIAIPCGILAVIFGVMSLGQIRRGEAQGRGFAITALTTGIVSLGIVLFFFLVVGSIIGRLI
jgi:uncharacterized protein DUF4190/zinc ribbon protein